MPGQLAGKIALVTGGSSGIGRATALAFAREGAKVIVADLAVPGGRETVRLIAAAGGEGRFMAADVSQADQVEALIRQTVAAYGRLDCACNNAGIQGDWGLTADCTEENWDRTLATNLKGVWLCLKHEIPQMLRQGGGAIINMASAVGLVGNVGNPAYVASKHGIVGLTKAAALEYAGQQIRINAVCPGGIRTPMLAQVFQEHPDLAAPEAVALKQPLGRLGEPEEIAAAVVWLCSDAASLVVGCALAVDGGWVAQ